MPTESDFTTYTLGSASLAATTADMPMLVGSQALEFATSMQWRSTGSWDTGSDITDTTMPTRFAADRYGVGRTAPNSSAATATTTYLMLDLNPATVPDIDMALIWNHNLDQVTGLDSVALQISQFSDFSAITTLKNWTSFTNDRIVSLNLTVSSIPNSGVRGVRYARLAFHTSNGGGFVTVPALGELWLGTQRQLGHFPQIPWDENTLQSNVADFNAKSGHRIRYVRNRGQRVFEPTWNTGTPLASGINDVTVLRTFWTECRYGSKPVLFIQAPHSHPERVNVCLIDPPVLKMPLQGPSDRLVSMTFNEIAPYLQTELE